MPFAHAASGDLLYYYYYCYYCKQEAEQDCWISLGLPWKESLLRLLLRILGGDRNHIGNQG